jgi:hypothetical protein
MEKFVGKKGIVIPFDINLNIDKLHNAFILSIKNNNQEEIIKGKIKLINCHYYVLEPENYKNNLIELLIFSHKMFMMGTDRDIFLRKNLIDPEFNFDSMIIFNFDTDIIKKGTYKILKI